MSTTLTVTRIGHACQLIEIGGTRVFTTNRSRGAAGLATGGGLSDPVRSARVSRIPASMRQVGLV